MKEKETNNEINIPQILPFLEAICGQTHNVYRFTPEQMLSRYERGWRYRKIFDLEEEELNFIKNIASICKSWLITEL